MNTRISILLILLLTGCYKLPDYTGTPVESPQYSYPRTEHLHGKWFIVGYKQTWTRAGERDSTERYISFETDTPYYSPTTFWFGSDLPYVEPIYQHIITDTSNVTYPIRNIFVPYGSWQVSKYSNTTELKLAYSYSPVSFTINDYAGFSFNLAGEVMDKSINTNTQLTLFFER